MIKPLLFTILIVSASIAIGCEALGYVKADDVKPPVNVVCVNGVGAEGKPVEFLRMSAKYVDTRVQGKVIVRDPVGDPPGVTVEIVNAACVVVRAETQLPQAPKPPPKPATPPKPVAPPDAGPVASSDAGPTPPKP